MNKIMTLLFLMTLSLPLVACSNQSNQTLDGEYYWVNESRNERAFTISGNIRTINSCLFSYYVLKAMSTQELHHPKKTRNIVLLYLTALLRR